MIQISLIEPTKDTPFYRFGPSGSDAIDGDKRFREEPKAFPLVVEGWEEYDFFGIKWRGDFKAFCGVTGLGTASFNGLCVTRLRCDLADATKEALGKAGKKKVDAAIAEALTNRTISPRYVQEVAHE